MVAPNSKKNLKGFTPASNAFIWLSWTHIESEYCSDSNHAFMNQIHSVIQRYKFFAVENASFFFSTFYVLRFLLQK